MNPNKLNLAEEKQKIKEMSFKEAVQYIWTYFWIPIVAVVFVLAFGAFMIVRITTNIPDNWLSLTFANTTADVGTGSDLWKDFTETAGYDLTEKKVEFNAVSYFDYLQNQAKGNAYYNAFIALADAGELDGITMESDSLAALGQSGRLLDLNDERAASIKAKYGDRFIYYEPPEDDGEHDGPIPVGIDISDSILVSEYHMYLDSCAIGIGAQSKNLEEAEFFIDYVLGRVNDA
ncbi:MAG: hypothetical protein IJH32_10950 [Ruminococcus sp.]|nr:hypothetical protein [Ruminococcus sp.]